MKITIKIPFIKDRPAAQRRLTVPISGMTCHSCEITVERKFLEIPGIQTVKVSARTGLAEIIYASEPPKLSDLQSAIANSEYKITDQVALEKPSWKQILASFAVVIFLGTIFSKIGWLKPQFAADQTVQYGSVFFLGLVAASSSCVAVAGGLLLSAIAKYPVPGSKLPIFSFALGRLLAYGILGAVIGFLGGALSPSPLVMGLITLVAAVYMIVIGLDMLGLIPRFIRNSLPGAPKFLSHKILKFSETRRKSMPFLLGAATFFLPCGFTQSLQIYALSTGDPKVSAGLLFFFALGTLPALLVLGLASTSLTGKWSKHFYYASGAAVLLLGFLNVQNALTVAGYEIVIFPERTARAEGVDPNVKYDGKVQKVTIVANPGGYYPENINLLKNIPVQLSIDAKDSVGCQSIFQIPKYRIRTLIRPEGKNLIEFTPTETGQVVFSCGMGMYRGKINVISKS